MKSLTSLLGLFLIIFGIFAFVYKGIPYTKKENVVQIGDLSVTADTNHTLQIPPIVGGLAILAGVVLVVVGRRK